MDRLNSRWNRFSWFGLLGVGTDGSLHAAPLNTGAATLVATMEALLIETLEPPQNRKRGDDFYAVEYIQGTDPEIADRGVQEAVRAFERQLRDRL